VSETGRSVRWLLNGLSLGRIDILTAMLSIPRQAIADQVPGRNHTQCLQRWTKVLKPGLIKVRSLAVSFVSSPLRLCAHRHVHDFRLLNVQGHWTPEEDSKLRELVAEGKKNWGQVASLIPGRT
jgi:hypothetical protein